jgi:hypothetical protein
LRFAQTAGRPRFERPRRIAKAPPSGFLTD